PWFLPPQHVWNHDNIRSTTVVLGNTAGRRADQGLDSHTLMSRRNGAMALFDDIVEGFGSSWVPTVLVGVGVALVAPVVVPALAAGMRPLAKAVIKGGVMVYDKGAEVLAEAGEQLSDLVAEVRSEIDATATAAADAAAAAATDGHPLAG